MVNERTEISVVVQQRIPAGDAPRGDDRIDRFANRNSETAQRPEVPRRLNCDLLPAQLDNR